MDTNQGVLLPDTDKIVPKLINFNIRGNVYVLPDDILRKEVSLLASITNEEQCKFYRRELDSIYMNANTAMFEKIIEYHTTGELHLPENVCLGQIRRELQFWQVPDTVLAPCCWNRYCEFVEKKAILEEVQGVSCSTIELDNNTEVSSGRNCGFPKLWRFLDDPFSSKCAMIFAVFSCLVTLITIVALALDSCLPLRVSNDLVGQEENLTSILSVKKHRVFATTKPHGVIMVILLTGFSLLNLELIARVITCPRKIAFFKSRLNIIDIAVMIPFWILIFMLAKYNFKITLDNIQQISTLRSCSCVMILKTVRHLGRIKLVRVLSLSLMKGINVHLFAVSILLFSAMLFSALAYIAETDNVDAFWSIPESFYWALVTMTTVGYGDIYPKTVYGQVVAIFCCISGIVVLAMPIPILSSLFSSYYDAYVFGHRLQEQKQRKCLFRL